MWKMGFLAAAFLEWGIRERGRGCVEKNKQASPGAAHQKSGECTFEMKDPVLAKCRRRSLC